MRLLDTETLRPEIFNGPKFPPYAILSHTWGDGEVLFQQIKTSNDGVTDLEIRGWDKISNACRKACQHDPPLEYIWIDTCCIDTTSSAELSEALNSMFTWYESAAICYAYLEDVDASQMTVTLESSMKKARWFTRGWTLQELVAPETVVFFSSKWETIGTKNSLRHLISTITRVDIEVRLKPKLLPTMSIARRMSWASNRETKRPEDIAYCLMGIFDVNMPLLYGEGNKAFIRLQEEIIKDSEDHSLFAWQCPTDSTDQEGNDHLENEGILAHHPMVFKNSLDIVPHRTNHAPYRTTNRGLEIEMPITDGIMCGRHSSASFIGILSCHYDNNLSWVIGIPLNRTSERYYREKSSKLLLLQHEKADSAQRSTLHIHKSGKRPPERSQPSYCYLHRYPPEVSFLNGIAVAAVSSLPTSGSGQLWEPGDSNAQWNTDSNTVKLSTESEGHFGALEFTNLRGPNTNVELLDGFTVLVKLFPYSFGIVAMVPWSRHERTTVDFLRQTLEKYHNAAITFTTGNFRVGKGNLRVALERRKVFDHETYIMDIDYHPPERSSPANMNVNRVPDLRLLEVDG